MDLSGKFIEEKPTKPSFFTVFLSSSTKGKQLRKWLEDMQKYTDDPNVHGLIIDLGSVGAGFAKKNEISDLVKFLCSEDNSYITGQIITIDGGFVCK